MAGLKKQSLFTRLASYSQNPRKQSLENFTTEVLVYLFNNDQVFKDIFVLHIIRDKRLQQIFKKASAESQQAIKNGIVDIILSLGHRRVLIEVKIGAAETWTKIYGKGWVSQVWKYLNSKEGDVAYLTTKAVEAPKLKNAKPKRYLGHFYFEDLYDSLAKAKARLTEAGLLFLEFMKENDMKPPEPFTKNELEGAASAFAITKKCEDYLNEIGAKVEPGFQKIFKTRMGFKKAHFNLTEGYASIGTKNKLRRHQKWVGVSIWPENDGLRYGIWVTVPTSDIRNLNQLLKNWQKGPEKGTSYLFTSRPLNSREKIGDCVKWVLGKLQELNRALNKD